MATQTKVATNLFATSVMVKQPAAKKADKKIVKVADLGDKITTWAGLKGEIESKTALLKMLEGDIKAAGRFSFMEQYKAQKSTPDNFHLQDEVGSGCLFICMDKYTVVDETKAEVLGNFEGLLNETVVYKFNPELVEKYGAVLSALIMGSKQIADEDKGLLITGEKTFSVAKGSIDRLMLFPEPEMIFDLINPICSLKK